MIDKYQERYLEHIQNKMKRDQKKVIYSAESIQALYDIMENRKSVRRFTEQYIDDSIYDLVHKALDTAPSSCNRHGIYLVEMFPEVAEELLVGGTGWMDKANKVFLLFGARDCYKNPKEVAVMPFLDAGFVAQNIYLLCEAQGIGCCFVNPNLKKPIENKDFFCGAVAVGNYV